MARVQLEQVTKVYPGNVRAVDGVDLTIADREFVVLVGPSGCGKSTTLRMIAGLEELTGGTIRIGERVVNQVPPKDRDIAMVFQNYALYPHMTVFKNMAFGLELRRLPGFWWRVGHPGEARRIRTQIAEKVRHAAGVLDITHLLHRKPRELSGGQRQRVALGRAIVREPAAFLFDEPLSNLDAKLRVTTRAELKRLHQRLKTTTIYVTHDQEEAMTLGDRIVVMKEGRVQQADSPLNLYTRPANRFVAGFIGMPPMNFFNGVLKILSGHLVFLESKPENSHPVGSATEPGGFGLIDDPAVKFGDPVSGGTGFAMSVPPHLSEVMTSWVDRPVVLGIRPEHLYLSPAGCEGRYSPLSARLNVVEPLGNNMDLYVQTRFHDHVVARVEACGGLETDTRITLHADSRRVHFFEPGETGMNLSLTKDPSHALA